MEREIEYTHPELWITATFFRPLWIKLLIRWLWRSVEYLRRTWMYWHANSSMIWETPCAFQRATCGSKEEILTEVCYSKPLTFCQNCISGLRERARLKSYLSSDEFEACERADEFLECHEVPWRHPLNRKRIGTKWQDIVENSQQGFLRNADMSNFQ